MIEFYALTEKGKRERNEDSMLAEKINDYYVFAVADGLGGHVSGDIASKMAIIELREVIKRSSDPPKETLIRAFKKANEEIMHYGKMKMGTTLVACMLDENGNGVIANVGDSRAYIIDEDGIWHTKDHSLVQELIDAGVITEKDAFNHPHKNVVTRALGLSKDVEVDIYDVKLRGKILLLCSDGLHDYVRDERIWEIVLEEQDLEKACKMLVDEALKSGSGDNITAILVSVF